MDNLEKWMDDYNNGKISLLNLLEKFTDDTIYEFDIFITKIVNSNKESEIELIDILKDKTNNPNARYAAFFGLCVLYRRYKDYSKFEKLLQDYKDDFNECVTYSIQEAIFLKTRNNDGDVIGALEIWDNLSFDYTKNPGFVQAYADTVAIAFEGDYLQINEQENKERIYKTIKLVKAAIRLKQYPKYYATLGRLQAVVGDCKSAIYNVKVAIDKENSTSIDYAIRIGDYQSILAKISIKQYSQKEIEKMEQFQMSIEKVQDDFEKAKFDNITFLGFFTAILSLIIGSVQLISGQKNFIQAVQLLLILCGILIISFNCFNMLFQKKLNIPFRNIVLFIIGIAIIIFALLAIPVLYKVVN